MPDRADNVITNRNIAFKMPTATMIAAYCRLHELEAKRRGYSVDKKSIIRFPSIEEQNEYRRLMTWWSQLGGEKQEIIIDLVGDMSEVVEQVMKEMRGS